MFLHLLFKELRLEWRSRARLSSSLVFALLTTLLFSFAVGPREKLLEELAGGFFWLSLFLASHLSLLESMRTETENAALDGMRLLPVSLQSFFLAKALMNAGILFGLGLVVLLASIVLYGAHLELGLLPQLLILLLGSLALSAPGTLYAAIVAQSHTRDVMLPLLLFPILIPALLAAVKGSSLAFAGDPMQQFSSWATLLLAFNIVYWLLCVLLFPKVIEE